MHDETLVGFFALAEGEPTGDPPRSWIQVLVTVEKAEKAGQKFTVTPADLEAYAADISGRAGRIPIDYDHSFQHGQGSRAAGWFTGQTDVRGEQKPELWAEVEWTAAAAAAIRSGEYRYVSPEFTFRERVKGVLRGAGQLLAAALTNRPFFETMAPVSLHRSGLRGVYAGNLAIPLEMQEALAAAWDLEPGDVLALAQWTTAYVNDLNDSAFLHVLPGGSKSGGKTTPRSLRMFPYRDDTGAIDLPHLRNALARIPQSNRIDQATKTRLTTRARRLLNNTTEGEAMNPEIMKALGLAEDATDEQVIAAVKERDEKLAAAEKERDELKATAETDKDGKTEDQKRIEKLEADLDAEKTLRLDGERETILALAVTDGRIVPAQKEQLSKAFGADMVALKAFVEATPKQDRREKGHGGGGGAVEVTEAVKASFTSDDITPDEESLDLHVQAEALLAKDGKHPGGYSTDEYMLAIDRARRGERVAA